MEKLHQDIILDTLLRLPYQSIVNCKLVCKSWRDLLSNTKLSILFRVGKHRFGRHSRLCHGRQAYDDIDIHGCYSDKTLAKFDNHPSGPLPDSLSELVGSCNGLVCFSVAYHDNLYDPIYICNPVTGEYLYLPKYILRDEDYDCGLPGSFISGFGYNYSTDKYKVVRMYVRDLVPEMSLKVQVYTLGSGLGWRDKGTAGLFISITDIAGVCANGALHWIEMKKCKIVAFDLTDEKFMLIPLPSVYSRKSLGKFTLKLLRGYLSVFHVDEKESQGTFINIWSLKKKKKCNGYDVGEDEFDNYWSWNKEFSIPWDGTKAKDSFSYHPFAVTKSNQVLLWIDRVLSCYHFNTTTLTQLWDDHPRLSWVEALPHLNSLISLQALGEKSMKRI